MSSNYLYEIIEDYKEASSIQDKNEIFDFFCSSIWNSKNKRSVYNKSIKFYIKDSLIDSDIGQIFNTWSNIGYKVCKFVTKDDDWCELIRQKINNLYSIYCDKEVILNKEYINLLKTPKRLYYKWINGQEFNTDELTDLIDEAIHEASNAYKKYQNQKMDLSWEEYRDIITVYLRKIFDNCKLIDEYEKTHETTISIYQDFMTEDNFYIKYFCNSLESYMRNYQKEYYGLSRGRDKRYKRCDECGKLIEIINKKDFSTKYCDACKKNIVKNQTKERVKKYRDKQCNASKN